MTVLRWQLLPVLGHVLLQVADLLGASAYSDHYSRDLGVPAASTSPAAAVPITTAAAAAAPPADMFRALQQLLQGHRDASSINIVPMLVQQRVACVQRSIDLMAAYSLLGDAAASISASFSLEATQVGCPCRLNNRRPADLPSQWDIHVGALLQIADYCGLQCLTDLLPASAGCRSASGDSPPHCAPVGAPALDAG